MGNRHSPNTPPELASPTSSSRSSTPDPALSLPRLRPARDVVEPPRNPPRSCVFSTLPRVSDTTEMPRCRYRPGLTPGISPTFLVIAAIRPVAPREGDFHHNSNDSQEFQYPVVFVDPVTLAVRGVVSHPNVQRPFQAAQQVSDRVIFLNPAGWLGPPAKQCSLLFREKTIPSCSSDDDIDFDLNSIDLEAGLYEISTLSTYSAGFGMNYALCFEDLSKLIEVGHASGHTGPVKCLSAPTNYDYDVVVSGSLDKTTRIWDCRTNQAVQVFVDKVGQVLELCTALDRWVVCTLNDSAVLNVWDPRKSDAAVVTLSPHGNCVAPVAHGRQGACVARVSCESAVSTRSDYSVGTVRFRFSDGKISATRPTLGGWNIGLVYDGNWQNRIQRRSADVTELIQFVVLFARGEVVLKALTLKIVSAFLI